MPSKPSFKLNALSNLIVTSMQVAITFFLTPVMLAHLGERRFGIWTLVSSLVGYFGMLQFGLTASVFYYVPLFRGRGEHERVGAIVSTALAFYLGLGLLVLVTLSLAADFISSFFNGGIELTALTRIAALAFAMELPCLVLSTAIRGHEGFTTTNIVGGLGLLARGGLLFACIWLDYGLIAMGCVLLVIRLASLTGLLFVLRRHYPQVQVRPSLVRWSDLRMLLTFGGVIVLVSVANSVALEAPKQIVCKIMSMEVLTLFAVPLMLISYFRQFIFTLTQILTPRISYLSSQNKMPEIQSLFLRSSRYISTLATSVAVIGWLAGPPFFPIWTRNEQMRQAVPVFLILLGGNAVLLSNRVTSDLLLGLGRRGVLAVFEVVEAIAIMLLVYPLSRHFGIVGAAIGMALPFAVVRGVLQPFVTCRIVGVGVWDYVRQCLWRPWILAVITACLVFASGLRTQVQGWPSLITVSVLGLLVYGVLLYVFVAQPDERRQLLAASRRYLRLGSFV